MRFILMFIFTIVVTSCSFSLQKKEDMLRSMGENITVIPYDKMVCWVNDSMVFDTIGQQAKYKLVVYVDSNACSTCYLNEMYQWKDFVEMEEKSYFSINFIFAPPLSYRYNIQNHFYRTELNHPIYVDTSCCFLDVNPHIPVKFMYHTFLLDENNKVVLVGDPLHNVSIENMLKEILDKGKRK